MTTVTRMEDRERMEPIQRVALGGFTWLVFRDIGGLRIESAHSQPGYAPLVLDPASELHQEITRTISTKEPAHV